MVNTFVISSDLYESAMMLDKRRLNKQCWEAKMVVIYLQSLEYVASYLNMKRPEKTSDEISDFMDNIEFSRDVLVQYDNIRQMKKIKIVYSPSGFLIKSVYDPVVSSEREILRGFRNHPATLMWSGYLDAIKYYFNIHVDVSIARGININTTRYPVSEVIDIPWWLKNKNIIHSYRNNLLFKEIVRGEPSWYIYQEKILNTCKTAFFGCGNLWIAKLPYHILNDIYNNNIDNYNVWDITDTPSYSKPNSPIIIREVKEFPRNKGWILLQIYFNENMPEMMKRYAYKNIKIGVSKGFYAKELLKLI